MSLKKETIFRPFKTYDHGQKRWNFIHFVLKYRIILPFLKVLAKMYPDYVITRRNQVPNKPWNNNIRIFDYTFEKSLKKWSQLRLNHSNPLKQYDQLRLMKNTMLTVIMEDTAYRDLFNILLLELYNEMYEFYGTDPKSYYLYTGKDGEDQRYFKLWEGEKTWQTTDCTVSKSNHGE